LDDEAPSDIFTRLELEFPNEKITVTQLFVHQSRKRSFLRNVLNHFRDHHNIWDDNYCTNCDEPYDCMIDVVILDEKPNERLIQNAFGYCKRCGNALHRKYHNV
jgi:hypothetical protein